MKYIPLSLAFGAGVAVGFFYARSIFENPMEEKEERKEDKLDRVIDKDTGTEIVIGMNKEQAAEYARKKQESELYLISEEQFKKFDWPKEYCWYYDEDGVLEGENEAIYLVENYIGMHNLTEFDVTDVIYVRNEIHGVDYCVELKHGNFADSHPDIDYVDWDYYHNAVIVDDEDEEHDEDDYGYED